MALVTKLNTVLRTICPRTFPDFAPVDTPRPYVIYQGIGGQALGFVDNTIPSKKNTVVQIAVWSDTRLEAESMINEIEIAMIRATEFQARPIAAEAHHSDPDTGRRVARQDFSVWYDR